MPRSALPGTSVLEGRIDGIHHRDGDVEYRTLIDGFLFDYVTATQNWQFRYQKVWLGQQVGARSLDRE